MISFSSMLLFYAVIAALVIADDADAGRHERPREPGR
jgi:hypothetical protein